MFARRTVSKKGIRQKLFQFKRNHLNNNEVKQILPRCPIIAAICKGVFPERRMVNWHLPHKKKLKRNNQMVIRIQRCMSKNSLRVSNCLPWQIIRNVHTQLYTQGQVNKESQSQFPGYWIKHLWVSDCSDKIFIKIKNSLVINYTQNKLVYCIQQYRIHYFVKEDHDFNYVFISKSIF